MQLRINTLAFLLSSIFSCGNHKASQIARPEKLKNEITKSPCQVIRFIFLSTFLYRRDWRRRIFSVAFYLQFLAFQLNLPVIEIERLTIPNFVLQSINAIEGFADYTVISHFVCLVENFSPTFLRWTKSLRRIWLKFYTKTWFYRCSMFNSNERNWRQLYTLYNGWKTSNLFELRFYNFDD